MREVDPQTGQIEYARGTFYSCEFEVGEFASGIKYANGEFRDCSISNIAGSLNDYNLIEYTGSDSKFACCEIFTDEAEFLVSNDGGAIFQLPPL